DTVQLTLQIHLLEQLYFSAFFTERIRPVVSDDFSVFIKLKSIGVYVFLFNMKFLHNRDDKFFETAGYDQYIIGMLFKKRCVARKRLGNFSSQVSNELLEMIFIGF